MIEWYQKSNKNILKYSNFHQTHSEQQQQQQLNRQRGQQQRRQDGKKFTKGKNQTTTTTTIVIITTRVYQIKIPEKLIAVIISSRLS